MGTKRDSSIRKHGRILVLASGVALAVLAVSDTPRGDYGSGCAGSGRWVVTERDVVETTADNGGRRLGRARENPARRGRDHPAFQERAAERERMVQQQIAGREVEDPNVLQAMRRVPRHAFVPPAQRAHAYEDRPLPIGYEQTISQPYVVAFMTEALQLDPHAVVLEIGTGSGYQAAVCAEIARAVYSIEIVEPLAASAARTLAELGYANVQVRAGDGYFGWPGKGPFDAIIGTAAAREIPAPLVEQLKTGGRMILPVGDRFGLQELILVTKDEQGRLHRRRVMPVLFVPMTGRVREPQESHGTADNE
jgi:protein-L-isoaspartate(D-aspartate) O-methyltransferase